MLLSVFSLVSLCLTSLVLAELYLLRLLMLTVVRGVQQELLAYPCMVQEAPFLSFSKPRLLKGFPNKQEVPKVQFHIVDSFCSNFDSQNVDEDPYVCPVARTLPYSTVTLPHWFL